MPTPVSFATGTKVSDVASIDRSGNPIRFFDPRRDIWGEHFKLNGPVTARVLRVNASERVIESHLWQALPSPRTTQRSLERTQMSVFV